MNYRHSYHAGNFSDVFKHIILIALIESLLRKETGFCYLDTHAGTGCYDLSSEAAQKSKEYENGITKILNSDVVPELVQEYLNIVTPSPSLKKHAPEDGFFYPGSPEIINHFLRPQDRMILSELHPDDYQSLKKHFKHHKQIAIHHQDGYQSLKAFLPPKEKRGLILIDPPYEKADELTQLTTILSQALKRFETGVYAIWYPIKQRQPIDRFHQQCKSSISRPMLVCELSIYPDNLPTHLNGSGMIIINPPFQLDQQLQAVIPWLWKCLSINDQGQFTIKFL